MGGFEPGHHRGKHQEVPIELLDSQQITSLLLSEKQCPPHIQIKKRFFLLDKSKSRNLSSQKQLVPNLNLSSLSGLGVPSVSLSTKLDSCVYYSMEKYHKQITEKQIRACLISCNLLPTELFAFKFNRDIIYIFKLSSFSWLAVLSFWVHAEHFKKNTIYFWHTKTQIYCPKQSPEDRPARNIKNLELKHVLLINYYFLNLSTKKRVSCLLVMNSHDTKHIHYTK